MGRIVAKTRERGDGEFRAGPVIPLVDQAISGFSRSTWEVHVVDEEAADVELLRKEFPALQGAPVVKKILPSWDRAAAQE